MLPLGVRLGDAAVRTLLPGVHLPEHDRCTGEADTMAHIARNSSLPPLPADGPCTPGTDPLEVLLACQGPPCLVKHLLGRGDARAGVLDQGSTPVVVVTSERHRSPRRSPGARVKWGFVRDTCNGVSQLACDTFLHPSRTYSILCHRERSLTAEG